MSSPFFTEDMRDIADICGRAVALELLAELPGVEIKVPLQWSPDNPLSRLKRETADIIIREFAGNKFYVPTRRERIDTKAAARRLNKQGKSKLEIAIELHVSERYVRGILSGGKTAARARKVDDRQIDLEDFLSSQKS
ncbi:hypothetical protein J7481_19635 [Labrenzia sp. R4_2]|uniref:hypothetical protein n=1 Tax=Labrenzia sp. R4_2 TaxID=2821107 RepID=UPI001ADAC441|nr:hypothetical protein [Labrenzia sp. R4_2]MBO9421729.1 hypothetical protein [Labrenzia sp. R4_2]